MAGSGVRRKSLYIHIMVALLPAGIATSGWAQEGEESPDTDPQTDPQVIEASEDEAEAEASEDAPEEIDDSYELKRISVTGSRLRRTDWEGSLPVTTITREMIENSGEISTADVLRNLSFNTAGSYRFSDYLRFGGPLGLLAWLLAVLVIPLFWPF